jgi:hypothetical protein
MDRAHSSPSPGAEARRATSRLRAVAAAVWVDRSSRRSSIDPRDYPTRTRGLCSGTDIVIDGASTDSRPGIVCGET